MIQQKIGPECNLRRLLRLVMLGLREEAYTSPTTWLCSACDLCYPAFPQQIHISDVIGTVRPSMTKSVARLEALHTKFPPVGVVQHLM